MDLLAVSCHVDDRPLNTFLLHHVVYSIDEAALSHLFEVDVKLGCVVLYFVMAIFASFCIHLHDSLVLDLLSSLVYCYFLLILVIGRLFWRFQFTDSI